MLFLHTASRNADQVSRMMGSWIREKCAKTFRAITNMN